MNNQYKAHLRSKQVRYDIPSQAEEEKRATGGKIRARARTGIIPSPTYHEWLINPDADE